MRGVHARLHVDTRLRVQVNTASAQVASFEGVLRAELVLLAEIVLDGVRIFLVDHDVVGRGELLARESGRYFVRDTICCRGTKSLKTACAGQNSTVFQEIIDNRRLSIVDRAAELRR